VSAAPGAGPACADDERIRALLADTLALWAVDGTVEPGAAPCVAEVRAAGGRRARVDRAPAGSGFRWFVRWRDPTSGSERAPRPCGSFGGVLKAVRMALQVDRGAPLRIAASADPR
jgi:hypothetical protein